MYQKLLRIAFADDDMDDHLLFYKAVKSCYHAPVIDCFFNSADLMRFYTIEMNIAPHIIFLDKNMPGNYNYECLVKIKGSALFSGIPVIIYSTSDDQVEKEDAVNRGASSFITKPSSFAETVECLRYNVGYFVPHTLKSVVS